MVRWRAIGAAVVASLVLGAGSVGFSGVAAGGGPRALALEESLLNGVDSPEVMRATALGWVVDVVDSATWGAMTADDFDDYQAFIFGDAECGDGGPDDYSGPAATADIWGPMVTGNAVVQAGDPVYHLLNGGNEAGAQEDVDVAMEFALAQPVGLYVTLSCSFNVDDPTAIDFLSGVGAFEAGPLDLVSDDDIRVVGAEPTLDALSDADLSDWGASVHATISTWPDDWQVFAIAAEREPTEELEEIRTVGTVGPDGIYVAPDGSRGVPVVVFRTAQVAVEGITLAPATSTGVVGSSHTVTATVVVGGEPSADVEVTFTVTAGPNAGEAGTATTDAQGQATFTYTGTTVGTDTITASFVGADGEVTSNAVTREWTTAAARPAAVQPTFTG